MSMRLGAVEQAAGTFLGLGGLIPPHNNPQTPRDQGVITRSSISPKAACNYGGMGQRPLKPNQHSQCWKQHQVCKGQFGVWSPSPVSPTKRRGGKVEVFVATAQPSPSRCWTTMRWMSKDRAVLRWHQIHVIWPGQGTKQQQRDMGENQELAIPLVLVPRHLSGVGSVLEPHGMGWGMGCDFRTLSILRQGADRARIPRQGLHPSLARESLG